MRGCGARLAEAGLGAGLVFLEGELGAGKTTWVRGFLHGLGIRGPVRSPTFTLVESYEGRLGPVHHLDLYRLADPDELEYLGIRDLLVPASLCLVEWPERAAAALPRPDLRVRFEYLPAGRRVTLEGADEAARNLVARAYSGE